MVQLPNYVKSFKCGGLAIGLCMNHILLDGMSAKGFNQNLASQALDDEPLAVVPCFDRHLMTARSPPRPAFDHPEFFKPDLGPLSSPPVFDCKREELEYRVFQLSPSHIKLLKEMAESETRISSLSVVVALVWKCKERVSTLLNGRQR